MAITEAARQGTVYRVQEQLKRTKRRILRSDRPRARRGPLGQMSANGNLDPDPDDGWAKLEPVPDVEE
jgi:hypothetical protein